MPSCPARLLCVGNELDHLQSRCAVLESAGYDAKSATVSEAEILLGTEEFDLVIVSSHLSREEKSRVISAAGKKPIVELEGLTFARRLLTEVELRLSPTV
jgi:CheY-like chemotaxis protein